MGAPGPPRRASRGPSLQSLQAQNERTHIHSLSFLRFPHPTQRCSLGIEPTGHRCICSRSIPVSHSVLHASQPASASQPQPQHQPLVAVRRYRAGPRGAGNYAIIQSRSLPTTRPTKSATFCGLFAACSRSPPLWRVHHVKPPLGVDIIIIKNTTQRRAGTSSCSIHPPLNPSVSPFPGVAGVDGYPRRRPWQCWVPPAASCGGAGKPPACTGTAVYESTWRSGPGVSRRGDEQSWRLRRAPSDEARARTSLKLHQPHGASYGRGGGGGDGGGA